MESNHHVAGYPKLSPRICQTKLDLGKKKHCIPQSSACRTDQRFCSLPPLYVSTETPRPDGGQINCSVERLAESLQNVQVRSTLLSNQQLSHACAPIATKCFVRASAVIPVALRHPGAGSLVRACSVDPRGDGSSLRVSSARLKHPWKRYCPNLASLVNMFATPSNAHTHCKKQHSAKALLYPNSRQPGAKTLFSSLQSRKALSAIPTTVVGNLTMRSCRQFCQASAPMSLMPDSTLTKFVTLGAQ